MKKPWWRFAPIGFGHIDAMIWLSFFLTLICGALFVSAVAICFRIFGVV